MKNLLITGTAGFIGINFLKHFVTQPDKYYKVVSIDKMGYATKYNADLYEKICSASNIESRRINLATDTQNPSGGLRIVGFDSNDKWDVLDFASESHVDNSIKDPNAIFNENVKIPAGVITLLGLENIDRYMHVSTDEVYGEIDYDKKQYDNWFTPFTPLCPNNPYSASKAAQDCYLMAMKHTFGLNVKFIRLANQFGPHQHPEKMLPATALRVINGESIKIYGEGLNIRQWTPVVDSVKIIYDCLIGKNDNLFENNVLHISKYELSQDMNQILYTNNEVVSIWEEYISSKGYDITKEYIEDRKGHDKVYALKSGFAIQRYFDKSLKTRFRETIDHYIENKELYNVK